MKKAAKPTPTEMMSKVVSRSAAAGVVVESKDGGRGGGTMKNCEYGIGMLLPSTSSTLTVWFLVCRSIFFESAR